MASTVEIESDFSYVKIISAETMIGLSEASKCAQIVKVFEDAYKSPLSIIILDDIERVKKILVIGTKSELNFLDSVGIRDAFSVTYHVPTLKTKDVKKVLEQLNVFSSDDVDSTADALNGMLLKKIYMVIEMAAQGEHVAVLKLCIMVKRRSTFLNSTTVFRMWYDISLTACLP